LPTYCAWGDLEHQIFHSCAISVKNFRPVGSIKLGIAFEKFQNLSEKEDHDIVFISQFRPTKGFLDPSADPDSIDSLTSKYQRAAFQLLRDFADRNGRHITVISKTRGPEDYPLEINYFKELASGLDFTYVEGDKNQRDFSTYFSCFSSKLAVVLNSSLGFELLAIGKKVLFCGSGIENFADQFDVRPYFDSLPVEVKLQGQYLEHFSQKVQTLDALSDTRFKALVHERAKPIVDFDPNNLTQHRVRQIILDSLK
jgi:surface carbohydrate biosynthesis protein